MQKKIRLGILFGGESPEHEVSLGSAYGVLGGINQERYDIVEIGITKNGNWVSGPGAFRYLLSLLPREQIPIGMSEVWNEARNLFPNTSALPSTAQQPSTSLFLSRLPFAFLNEDCKLDVIFSVIHGGAGEDGTIQGLCNAFKVALVGPGILGSAICFDKALCNYVLEAIDIPHARWFLVETWAAEKLLENCEQRIQTELGGYPAFVKPSGAGSSLGARRVKCHDDLQVALADAATYDHRIIIEKEIKGHELEIAVLGNHELIVSPVAIEVLPEGDYYDYHSKYRTKTKIALPASIPSDVLSRMQDLAQRAFRGLKCSGLARVDFFWDEVTDQVYLNELNTIPGFRPRSHYPELMKAAGLSYSTLIDKMIDLAIEERLNLPR